MKERLSDITSEVDRMAVSYNGGTEVDSLVYSQLEVDSPPANSVEQSSSSLGATGSPRPTPRLYPTRITHFLSIASSDPPTEPL